MAFLVFFSVLLAGVSSFIFTIIAFIYLFFSFICFVVVVVILFLAHLGGAEVGCLAENIFGEEDSAQQREAD